MCIFHLILILVSIPSFLILSVKNRGIGGFGLLSRQNLLSIAKVICWHPLSPSLLQGLTLFVGTYICGNIAGCTKISYRQLIHYCTREILIHCTSCFLFGTIGRCWLSVHYCSSVKIDLSNPALFSIDNLKLDRTPGKIKWKIYISRFKEAYIKSYKKQLPVFFSTALRCRSFTEKNIEKKHLCRHGKNYYYLWKSLIPVINLILDSRNMVKVSKKYEFVKN